MVSNLPDYIHFSKHISDDLLLIIDKINPDKIAILVDENTKANCLDKIQVNDAALIEIKSGEIYKTLETCTHIWNELTKMGCSRKSLLINLGGGVIGDMGGFCASTFKRGMHFINIPTTLLSQVDASIGGKLGVDFNGLKNHIGLFREPEKVIIHTPFLNSLPDRELKSGFAEIIKHSLIHDGNQWEVLLEIPFEKIDWNELIPNSVGIKKDVVEKDPFEKGLRKILNFGHSLGHAIESQLLQTDTPLLHGEAVAIGMILESHISLQKKMIKEEEFNSIKKFIENIFDLPKVLPTREELEIYLIQDKKNESGDMRFALLSKIGECQYDVNVSENEVNNALVAYNS